MPEDIKFSLISSDNIISTELLQLTCWKISALVENSVPSRHKNSQMSQISSYFTIINILEDSLILS